MYQPPHFREDRLEVQHALICAHPLGLLISAGPGGLVANPLPFVLHAQHGERGSLHCHLSRANPHWHELETAAECLVVFQGPQRYVTPSWYATKPATGKVVPTWNYAAVHVWAEPQVIHDEAWLRRQVVDLTAVHEGRFPEPWSVSDAPPGFVAAQLKGIVGIELPIARIEGKWKMSQNRPAADREGVIEGLSAGSASEAIITSRLEPMPPKLVPTSSPASAVSQAPESKGGSRKTRPPRRLRKCSVHSVSGATPRWRCSRSSRNSGC